MTAWICSYSLTPCLVEVHDQHVPLLALLDAAGDARPQLHPLRECHVALLDGIATLKVNPNTTNTTNTANTTNIANITNGMDSSSWGGIGY
jgi:hypothetical protein